jgi:hypothetical protein
MHRNKLGKANLYVQLVTSMTSLLNQAKYNDAM